MSALYNCFLTIICNISPYCKNLSTVTSVKLVSLFQLFTSPRFLYAAEQNHMYVALLLETFNNIIQYQYESNVNLTYAIVRRKDAFESLFSLSLSDAIRVSSLHFCYCCYWFLKFILIRREFRTSARVLYNPSSLQHQTLRASQPPPPARRGNPVGLSMRTRRPRDPLHLRAIQRI